MKAPDFNCLRKYILFKPLVAYVNLHLYTKALLRMLERPGEGWAADQEMAEAVQKGGGTTKRSPGVVIGVRQCALRALGAFAGADGDVLPAALRKCGGEAMLSAVAAGEFGCRSATLRQHADDILTKLRVKT